jgi:transcriptional regulator with XRE-family HTH domain
MDSPAVGRRRLAQELRRLRATSGFTISEVAGRLECSAGKISRIETGAVGVRVQDVRDLLDLYGVGGDRREDLVGLVRVARQRAWWNEYADLVPAESARFYGLEDGAATIRQHAVGLVPGLLQTPAYARAVLAAPGVPAEVVDRRLELRLRRQRLLDRPDPPRLHVLLDEAAVRREIGGPAVLAEQLAHLAGLGPAHQVQVLPFGVGGYRAVGVPFTVFSFADPADPQVAYLEALTRNTLVERAEEVGHYAAAFAEAADRALDPAASAARLHRRAATVTR